MKQVVVFVIMILVFSVADTFAAQVFFADFGNVKQGTAKSFTIEFNANDTGLTLPGDTPFDIIVQAPFTASPLKGTVRAVIKSSFTLTLPANAPIGVFDKVTKIVIHKSGGDKTIDMPTKAAVVGFPYTFSPAQLDLGTQSRGTLSIKNNSLSKETAFVSAREFGIEGNVRLDIIAGGTAQVVFTVLEGAAGPIQDDVRISDQRSQLSKTVVVTAQPGPTKPDLVASIVAVKVFPRAAGATETNIQVTYRVENTGFTTSTACAGKINLDNDKVLDVAVKALAPGASLQDFSTTVAFKTTATGAHKVKFIVDTDDKNAEILENNNTAVKDIVIQ